MRHDFYLAWRYLGHHRTRTAILVGCLSLLATLPLALRMMLAEGDRQMTARAESTPLLLGAKGSALDLTLGALYFNAANPSRITLAESDKIAQTGWADPLPVWLRFRIAGHALVGVTLDYFDFRQLSLAKGEMLAMLGECLLGADVADHLGLQPGDTLLTEPENWFDLSGAYPLKLHIAGVLAKSHSPDDQAIFIDLQTAWVIEGLGHGHAAPNAPSPGTGFTWGQPATSLLDESKLVTYNEITPENLDSFHFHGDPSTYPISAVIALPHDRKASTLLRGRYLDGESPVQLVRPIDAVRQLLENIFRLNKLFNIVLGLVGTAVLLALGLVFALSLRLRQREIQTIFLLGCSQSKMLRLVLAEITLVVSISAAACGLFALMFQSHAGDLIRHFVMP